MTSPTTLQASLRAHLSPTAPPASSTLSRWTLSSLFLAETKPGARSSLPASWGEDRTAQRDPVERVERSGAEFGEGSSESAGEERSGTRNTLGGSGSTGKSFGSEGRNHDVDNHSSESVQNGHAVDSEAAEMIRHVKAILIEVPPLSAAATPLLLLSPSQIPDPTLVDHSKLLLALRNQLESIATTQEYSIILLSWNVEHVPTTSLFVSNYFALQRASRKNLQRLFIVGGGWWIRLILNVFTTTLLSGKTGRKVIQCRGLTELASHLGSDIFTSIEFPPAAYFANAVVENSISLPPSPPGTSRAPKMFGVSLEMVMDGSGSLPRVVSDCLKLLMSDLDSVGVFRQSPHGATLKQIREAYDRGHPMNLSSYPDSTNLAASLLKLFLRSLETPIFPPAIYSLVQSCPPASTPIPAIDHIRTALLPALSPLSLHVLSSVITVVREVKDHSAVNLMDTSNLVICLTPCLCDGGGVSQVELMRIAGWQIPGGKRVESGSGTVANLLRILIDHNDEVFDTPTTILKPVSTLHNPIPKPSRSPVLLNLPSSIPEEPSYLDDERPDLSSQIDPKFSSIAELSSHSRANPVRRRSISRRMERSSSSSSTASTSSRASITSLMLLDGAGHFRHTDADDESIRSEGVNAANEGKGKEREGNQETITKRRRGRISQSAVDLKDVFGKVV